MKIPSASSPGLSSTVIAALALALGACATQPAATSSAPAAAPVAAAPASANPAPVVAVVAAIDFDKQVKPFFTEYCAGCHSGARARDGVHVDTKAGLLSLITPGDPDHSRLFAVIAGPRKNMPPRNAAQPDAADLAMIKQWITEGAKIADSYPAGVAASAQAE